MASCEAVEGVMSELLFAELVAIASIRMGTTCFEILVMVINAAAMI